MELLRTCSVCRVLLLPAMFEQGLGSGSRGKEWGGMLPAAAVVMKLGSAVGVRGSERRKCVMAEQFYWRSDICVLDLKCVWRQSTLIGPSCQDADGQLLLQSSSCLMTRSSPFYQHG